MSDFFYGLKIPAGQCSAKCIQVCRKHTDLAMGEIRRRSDAGEYITVLDAIAGGSERKMLAFKKALAKGSADPAIWADFQQKYNVRFACASACLEDAHAFVVEYLEGMSGEYIEAFKGEVRLEDAFLEYAPLDRWLEVFEVRE